MASWFGKAALQLQLPQPPTTSTGKFANLVQGWTRRGYHMEGDITQFEVANEFIDQEAYSLYNASITWLSSDDAWLVGLHGKNLGDEEYRTAGYCFGFSAGCPSAFGIEDNTTVFFGPPRTWTATVEYRF